MRVISGMLKGRNIKGDKIKGTRPTMDKIKQSLFAMIQNDVKDAICLDLFAGSGSLGIEAISNGASYVYFVDKNKVMLGMIIIDDIVYNLLRTRRRI
jgi:16S rRNA (guanine966-N2)-methyltransferase